MPWPSHSTMVWPLMELLEDAIRETLDRVVCLRCYT
jgi:hypothetical protein